MKNLAKLHSIYALLIISVCVNADPLTIPHAFNAGGTAVAQEVNDNFSVVASEVNNNQRRIGAMEAFSMSIADQSCSGLSYLQGVDAKGNIICSTDLLGTGYSRRFPQVMDNLATLEIAGVILNEPVLVISGAGYDIERIASFDFKGDPNDKPGFAMEHDFVIEAGGADAVALKSYFDDVSDNLRDMELIIKEVNGAEKFRIQFFQYDHFSYEKSIDGRTRFTFVSIDRPDDIMRVAFRNPDPFQNNLSNNPEADTHMQIEGVVDFYPEITAIDKVERTITLTYDITEGNGIADWVKNTIEGNAGFTRVGSVILEKNGIETSRINYFGLFPMSWEIYDGFGLYGKIKARVVLSFDVSATG